MILAIAEDNKMIADHLGHCKGIHFYEIEEGKIVKDELIPCTGEGHEYMLSLLKELSQWPHSYVTLTGARKDE